MDRQLREVLRKEGDVAHQFTENKRSTPHVERVVNAEGVKDGRKQHVLSNERGKASAFQIGLEERVTQVVSHELQQHVQREHQVD